MSDEEVRGTLKEGEPHPAAYKAMNYLLDLGMETLAFYSESLASVSLSGSFEAEILSETMHRVMAGKKVSDRYLLGLAWTIRDYEEVKEKRKEK